MMSVLAGPHVLQRCAVSSPAQAHTCLLPHQRSRRLKPEIKTQGRGLKEKVEEGECLGGSSRGGIPNTPALFAPEVSNIMSIACCSLSQSYLTAAVHLDVSTQVSIVP